MSTVAHKCVYIFCGKSKKTDKECSFFKFPIKDIIRCKQWRTNCGNLKIAALDVEDLHNKLICERHFLERDIIINNKRKLLRYNAVPVQYLREGAIRPQSFPRLLPTAMDITNVVEPPSLRRDTSVRTYGAARKRTLSSTSDVDSKTAIEFVNVESLPEIPVAGFSPGEHSEIKHSVLVMEDATGFVLKSLPETSTFTNSTPTEQPDVKERIVVVESMNTFVLKEKCEMLTTTIAELRRKVNALQSQRDRYLKKKHSFTIAGVLNNLLRCRSDSAKTFINMQLKHCERSQWTNNEKLLALSLYHKSPIAYKFMLNNLELTLPSIRIIQRWLKLKWSLSTETTNNSH